MQRFYFDFQHLLVLPFEVCFPLIHVYSPHQRDLKSSCSVSMYWRVKAHLVDLRLGSKTQACSCTEEALFSQSEHSSIHQHRLEM